MRIQFNSFSNVALSSLNESTLPSPTSQWKKILIVVAVVFACLAILYRMGRNARIEKIKKTEAELAKLQSKVNSTTPFGKTIENPFFNSNDKTKSTSPSKGNIAGDSTKDNNFSAQEKKTTPDEKIIEEGETKDGKLHGQGKRIFPSGDIWEGEFQDGKLNGPGKKIYTRGDLEVGVYKDDLFHGFGKVTYTSGIIWEGEFRNNKMNGPAKIIGPDGEIQQEGEFKDNNLVKGKRIPSTFIEGKKIPRKPDEIACEDGEFTISGWNSGLSQGIRTYVNGKIEEGKFETSCLKDGKRTLPNGTIEKGSFKLTYQHNNPLHGLGKRTYRNGRVEEGEFADGVLNGKGEVTLADGTLLKGRFKNGCLIKGKLTDGKLNGQGKKIHPDGTVEEGTFKDDTLDGQGKRIYPDGSLDDGEFKEGNLIKGKFTLVNVREEEGQFKCGMLDGPAGMRTNSKFVKANDVTEETGEFAKGKLHGQGKRTYQDGKIEEGTFERGKLLTSSK